MKTTITHARGEFDVTPEFAAAHQEHLSASHDWLEGERQRLLNTSNKRRLLPAEQERLASVTHVINVHRALDYFDDVHHSAFGYAGADQLHGNRATFDCGCEIHYSVDHKAHREGRHDQANPQVHRTEHHCHAHKHLTDPHEHHRALTAPRPGPARDRN